MSDYHQFCGLARALDVVGDRWSLLVVRELLVADGRHTELRAALPGVPSNLLADRLRDLVAAGVVARSQEPGRKAVTYALTDRGRELREPVLGLVRWGAPLLAPGPRSGDAVRPQWLGLAVEALLASRTSPRPEVVVLRGDGVEVVLATGPEGTRVLPGPAAEPAAVAEGPVALLLGVASGAVPLAAARARGAHVTDPRGVLARLVGEAGVGVAVNDKAEAGAAEVQGEQVPRAQDAPPVVSPPDR